MMGLEAIYPKPRHWTADSVWRRWVTGHRMRLISGRGRPWRRLRRPWFDMAGFEIVAPEASGEAVFSGFALKERHLIWDE